MKSLEKLREKKTNKKETKDQELGFTLYKGDKKGTNWSR